MKKIGGWVVMGSAALVLLSACGGRSDPATGGAGGNASVASGRVALGNKADALRELGVVSSLAGQVAGGAIGFNSAGSEARRVRPWDYTKGERGQVTAKDAQQGACAGGGSFTTEDDIEVSRSFVLFDGQSASVALTKGSDADCKAVWQQKDGSSDVLTLSGLHEAGSSESGLSYGVQGNASDFYTELHEKKNSSGKVVASERLQFRGVSEVRALANATRDARGTFTYRYDPKDGNFFVSEVGDSTAPFKVVQGETLTLAGPYGYSSKQCSGGHGTVATEEPVRFDDQLGLPNAGKLKISAGDSLATFTFQAGGTATLQIGNNSQTISAAELRAALNPANPC
jgi:hypothetical protein